VRKIAPEFGRRSKRALALSLEFRISGLAVHFATDDAKTLEKARAALRPAAGPVVYFGRFCRFPLAALRPACLP
jgi:hypothetical protein